MVALVLRTPVPSVWIIAPTEEERRKRTSWIMVPTLSSNSVLAGNAPIVICARRFQRLSTDGMKVPVVSIKALPDAFGEVRTAPAPAVSVTDPVPSVVAFQAAGSVDDAPKVVP